MGANRIADFNRWFSQQARGLHRLDAGRDLPLCMGCAGGPGAGRR
ncbi:MAG: hypothetical protein PVI91_04795 [Gammaproteobacteria bacterium]